MEGDAPPPLGGGCRRKRLHSAGPEDERRSWESGPDRVCERVCEEEQEELHSFCQRCLVLVSQLSREAAALEGPVPASFLFDQLQRRWHRRHFPADGRCDVCGASFQQLHHAALSREATPPPATVCRSEEMAAVQQRWSCEMRRDGAPWGWGGVHSTYLGGGGAKRLATVRPLPLSSWEHLEGVWRVRCHQPPLGSTADGGHVTTEDQPAAHSVGTQTNQTPSAATSFLIRTVKKLGLSHMKKSRPSVSSPPAAPSRLRLYTGGFRGALQLAPPSLPPRLLRAASKVKVTPGTGKIRVMVRISSSGSDSSDFLSVLNVDGRKKQLSLCETSSGAQRRSATSDPKTFTFDAIFTQDTSQAEICSRVAVDVIQSVVNGADGCIFCYGHADLGKTYTLIGRPCSRQSLGVAPTAITWLFQVLSERQKLGARFSVRVSAVEICGREETLSDLLVHLAPSSRGGRQEAPPPAVSLQEDPVCGAQLLHHTELGADNAEHAAFFLDTALAARWGGRAPRDPAVRRNSHFLFTLHVDQERLDRKSAAAAHSRLHLLDLGSCETDVSDGGGAPCLTLAALGNVILALANGAKHVPCRSSKLTLLLLQSLGNINCCSTMIAHVSDAAFISTHTLRTLQLAARVRRISSKEASSSSGGDSSCEEALPRHRPLHLRPLQLRPFRPHAGAVNAPPLLPTDPEPSSSSEHSCDTVIYVGPGAVSVSDHDLSDNEGPPFFIPIIPSLTRKRAKDRPRTDGDHFRCDTFAELQQRLDGIDKVPPVGTHARVSEPTAAQPLDPGPAPSAPGAVDLDTPQVAPLGRVGDCLRTVNIRRRPVQLNGEDELVLAVVEELPVPDNGRPAHIINSTSEGSLPPPPTPRSVSIISSIDDQLDGCMCPYGSGGGTRCHDTHTSAAVWSCDVGKLTPPENESTPCLTKPTKWHPVVTSTKAPPRASIPHHDAHPGPASPAQSRSRQEVTCDNILLLSERRDTVTPDGGGETSTTLGSTPVSADWTLSPEGAVAAGSVRLPWKKSSATFKVARTMCSPKKRAALCGVTSLERPAPRTGPTRENRSARGGAKDTSVRLPLRVATATVSVVPVIGRSALVAVGSKVRSSAASGSRSLSSSHQPSDHAAGCHAHVPRSPGQSPGRSPSHSRAKTGRGTKQSVRRMASDRANELAASSETATGSGFQIPSPYSTVTAPRTPLLHSSDSSSLLSGERPPAAGSSGYESLIRDSETSSTHESTSDGDVFTDRSRTSRRTGNGFLRRRLIPTSLPDTSCLGSDLSEHFEIKVYEIDDTQRVRKRTELMTAETFNDVQQGLLYFNTRLRLLERRQQRIKELRLKHERLRLELDDAKTRLMLDADRWNGKFDVDMDMDQESQEQLEVLAQATADLEDCVNLCKSRIMMETCFDVAMRTVEQA